MLVQTGLALGLLALLGWNAYNLRTHEWKQPYLHGVSYRLNQIATPQAWLDAMSLAFNSKPPGGSGMLDQNEVPVIAQQFDRSRPAYGIWMRDGHNSFLQFTWKIPLGSVVLRWGVSDNPTNSTTTQDTLPYQINWLNGLVVILDD